jgi:hypothetical protein
MKCVASSFERYWSALRSYSSGVIAGLDPAIYLHAKKMDPRVKPTGDDQRVDQPHRDKVYAC